MKAAIAATIASFEMIFFSHHHQSIFVKIVINIFNRSIVHETFLLKYYPSPDVILYQL